MEKELGQRLIKRVLINPYLDNFGVFNWNLWFLGVVSSGIVIFTFLLSVILISHNFNYLETIGTVQDTVIKLISYFVSSLLSSINSLNYLNDLLSFFNITNEKIFNFNVKILNPNISLEGWVLIIISFILGFKFQIFTIYQFYLQRKIKNVGFMNYYSPFIFTIRNYNRVKSNKLHMRLLDILKLESFDTESKSQRVVIDRVLQIFFNKKLEEVKDFDIQIRQKNILGFYHYQVWEVKNIANEEIKKESFEEIEEIDTDIEEVNNIKKIRKVVL